MYVAMTQPSTRSTASSSTLASPSTWLHPQTYPHSESKQSWEFFAGLLAALVAVAGLERDRGARDVVWGLGFVRFRLAISVRDVIERRLRCESTVPSRGAASERAANSATAVERRAVGFHI